MSQSAMFTCECGFKGRKSMLEAVNAHQTQALLCPECKEMYAMAYL